MNSVIKKLWLGSPPEKCDVCSTKIASTFIDGKIRLGPWANMCPRCHVSLGVGTGPGRGQQYHKQPNGEWLKTKG